MDIVRAYVRPGSVVTAAEAAAAFGDDAGDIRFHDKETGVGGAVFEPDRAQRLRSDRDRAGHERHFHADRDRVLDVNLSVTCKQVCSRRDFRRNQAERAAFTLGDGHLLFGRRGLGHRARGSGSFKGDRARPRREFLRFQCFTGQLPRRRSL
jgi:hypothetical protein